MDQKLKLKTQKCGGAAYLKEVEEGVGGRLVDVVINFFVLLSSHGICCVFWPA
jgi:hypothetical protein